MELSIDQLDGSPNVSSTSDIELSFTVHETEFKEVCLSRDRTRNKEIYEEGIRVSGVEHCHSSEYSVSNNDHRDTLLTRTNMNNVDQFIHIRQIFHETCQQIRLLERKSTDLQLRHQKTRSHKPLHYSTRLHLSVSEEVLEMFEQFATRTLQKLSDLYTAIKGYSLYDTIDYMDDEEIDILHMDTYLQDLQDDMSFIHDDSDSDSDIELIGVVDEDIFITHCV